jgi:hypothetical protein
LEPVGRARNAEPAVLVGSALSFGHAARFASLGIEYLIVKPKNLCQLSGLPIRPPRRPLGASPTGKARDARHRAGT